MAIGGCQCWRIERKSTIPIEEVSEAVNEMKSVEAPGQDGFRVEFLKQGGMAVLEWLVRLLNASFDMG